ncbi:HEAT repeat domain-containing protein [Poritiphilus flavus]|uniref:HEAT repeat domain-containing protein n=1 Tax=Poritiphilus flavus TaxID=2697053 RepID=A0A6L9E6Y5_9FLAO|nr:HEAT repeat domain-containing protein [Poritiphilus flavus]NAS10388.1 HEAT repeat domain-containing protein [Poritiphilus flavus]
MKEEVFENKAIAYLSGRMEDKEKQEFEVFLKDNGAFQIQFEQLQNSWAQLDSLEVPEPSERMDTSFYSMLYEEQDKAKKKVGFASQIRDFMVSLWRPQFAYGLALLAIGLAIGFFLRAPIDNPVQQSPEVVDSETETVREQLVLTLLEQPSANKRLQGINEANKIQKVDETVIRALLQTLNSDPNVNVRLAAIESLTNYLDNPIVREGLVQSIVSQESPIVQVTLANLMVALQEKKSIEPFKKLIRSKSLDSSVKKKLESSIQQII